MSRISDKDNAKLKKHIAAIIKSWQMACEDDPKIEPDCLAHAIVAYFAVAVRIKKVKA